MKRHTWIGAIGISAVIAPVTAFAVAGTTGAAASPGRAWNVEVIAQNQVVTHDGNPFSVSSADDLTQLGRHLFVGYQNGVGAQGEPTASGVDFSTVAEYSERGGLVASWDLTGKVDGLTADPATGRVVATVNEDANSSIYTIDPDATPARQVVHYQYSPSPLAHGGGTDAIGIYHGQVFVSASAPGTVATSPTPPALYRVDFTRTPGTQTGVADVTPVFFDNSTATVANTATPTPTPQSPNPPAWCSTPPCIVPAEGSTVTLALTDPDSNEVVPAVSPRFGGDFMLDSQGDQQLIFMDGSNLSVLDLNQSIDDTGFISPDHHTLFATDSTDNAVLAVTGPVANGEAIVSATPSNGNNPGTGPNYFGTLDLSTGTMQPIPALSAWTPHSLISGD